MNIYVDGVLAPPADAGALAGVTAAFPQPLTIAQDGYVVTYIDATGDLELKPGGGGGGGVVLSTANPQPLGSAAPGTTGEASDAGHVHALPNATAVGADPAGSAAAVTTTSLGAVPDTRTVAGSALSADITTAALKTTLGLGAVTATGADAAAARSAISAETSGAAAAAQAAAIATASADATSKANAAQAAAAAYTDGVSAGTEGVAADYTDSVAVVTLAAAAVDATTKANAAQAAAIAAAASDATTKSNAAVVSATAAAASDATTKANAAAAASLAKSGGTMSGAIAMGTSKVTGMGQATAAGDALAAPAGISSGSLLYWTSGTLSSLAPGSPFMIPRIAAAGSAVEWVAGSTALGVVPSLIPLCDYAVCAGPLTAVGRLRFDPGAWTKAATGYTTVLTLRLLGDVSGAFTGTFTLYNVTAATTDATLTATEAVPTTKSAVLALPAVATVYELRAAHNGTPITDYATVSGAVIEVSWSV